jgi:signal transduction histidine kinase
MYGGAWLAIVAHFAIRLPILAACAWFGASASLAQTDTGTRFVLVLYSSDQTLPATNIVGAEVLRELDASTAPKVEVRSDFLDMSRFKYPAYRDDLAEFLAKKYAGTGIDLVVALGPPALDFIATYRDQVAPGAKIVFGLVSEPELAESRLPKGEVSGIISDYDVARTLELALALQPEARNIVVASGSLPYDLSLEMKARQVLAPLAGRYAITYLSDLPFDEVLASVAALPRDTIVLVLSYFRDASGRRFVPREAGGAIARAASAPSYTPFDTFIGLGVVGGYTDTFESTGVALGKLALDVLSGKQGPGGDIRNPEHAFRVDARQLRHWDLPQANLPPDTVVLFAGKTVWEEYWQVIVGAVAVIALQSALLAALLIQHARRRRAEAARKAAEADAEAQRREVAHMSRVLILGELSGAIAHELNQPLTAILANAQAAQIMLARDTPDIDEALLALEDIVEDDNRAGQVIQRLRGLLKKDQGRWEAVDVNDIVRSTRNLVRSELVTRRIDAGLELHAPLDPVRGDPVQLQQVVLNLVVNAMDALAAKDSGERRLVLKTRAAERARVELAVIDNGPGIAPSEEGRLFQPFFTTKPQGLGLGLSISSTNLATQCGTQTHVRGQAGGAVATVTLPSAEMRAAAE